MTEPAIAETLAPVGQVAPGNYPHPTGWRILIEPIQIEEKTTGGIVLPTAAVEAKEHLRAIGRVVDMGPLCYKHSKFGPEQEPWCQVGDYVAYGSYAGQEYKVRNVEGSDYVSLRLVNDDEILAVVTNPESVLIYC